jgi:transposase InsO family protein
MNIHKNARLTPPGRLLLVQRIEGGSWGLAAAALAAGISERHSYRWLARYRSGGIAALADRSSAPQCCKHRIGTERVGEIEGLRRQRMSGPAIARQLSMPVSTVGAILRRLGLGKLAALDPKPAVIRYERQRPGELIHLDTKKLGRIAGIGHRITGRTRGVVNRHQGIGWEALHVCIDDATRLAYSEILANERKDSAIGFLERALGWFAGQGVTVERVMTDNGSAYLSKAFRAALAGAGLKHKRTRPYTPPDLRDLAGAPRRVGALARSLQYRAATRRTDPPPASGSGPLLRPDLTPTRTAAAGRGKDRRRRPASAGAQRPCGGPTLQSRSFEEGPLPDLLNNVPGNDS